MFSSSTPKPVTCARSRSRRSSASAYVAAWEAHAAELERFCGRYDIGYVRADAERPFEDVDPQGVPPGAVRRMTFGAMAAWQALAAARRRRRRCAAWLFLRKLRPPRMLVPSLLLWQRVLDEPRELTLWERIRRAVSLVLTVLIARGARACASRARQRRDPPHRRRHAAEC